MGSIAWERRLLSNVSLTESSLAHARVSQPLSRRTQLSFSSSSSCRSCRQDLPLVASLRAQLQTTPSLASSPTSQAKAPPFNVLITGSSKGIGYALAKKFLCEGDKVLICSRSGRPFFGPQILSVSKKKGQAMLGCCLRCIFKVKMLRKLWEISQWSLGTTVDVRIGESVQELVAFAKSKLGYVDIWINNAGSNAYSYGPLVEATDEVIMEIVETNTIGVMICCREAIKMMMNQERGGHIFNMDGAGADGRPTPRFAAYGATKRSLAQLTKSLQAELKMQGVKNVVIHMLSPGMVTTDLLMSGSNTPQAKFFINILAEPAETVAEYLVPRIRTVAIKENAKPTYLRFLTGFKAYSQILARLLFNARKNRHVQED